MPVANVVTIGWKRSTATQNPLSAPAANPVAMPTARPSAMEAPVPPMTSMIVTTATLTSETMAPADRSMSEARTT